MSRKETDLYPPIKALLEARGFEVKGEVGAADVVGRNGEDIVIVELKTGFSLALFHQALDRLAITDQVYVAVPAGGRRKALLANVKLARRLGLGVITVRARDNLTEVLAEPGPYRPRKSPKKAARLRAAFDRLSGDPNAGGATRHGLVTGYRQDALRCARHLAQGGAVRGAVVARETGVPTATAIMRDNHYGWFEKVDRGIYALSAKGWQGLKDWGDVD